MTASSTLFISDEMQRFTAIMELIAAGRLPTFDGAVFYSQFQKKRLEYVFRHLPDVSSRLDNQAEIIAASIMVRSEDSREELCAKMIEQARSCLQMADPKAD